MEQIGYIILGWFLGLLSPAIIEKIRIGHRAKSLRAAIYNELSEIQYIMAMLTYKLTQYNGLLSDDFLSWFEKIIIPYKGEESDQKIRELLPELKKISEKDRKEYCLNINTGAALGLIQYDLPLLKTYINEIVIMPVDEQIWAIKILQCLNMFNQNVANLQDKLKSTFDSSLSSENHQIILGDLKSGYISLSRITKKIVDTISNKPIFKSSWLSRCVR